MLLLYYKLTIIVVSYIKAFVLRFEIFEQRFGLYFIQYSIDNYLANC